jgi:hypothetical protein
MAGSLMVAGMVQGVAVGDLLDGAAQDLAGLRLWLTAIAIVNAATGLTFRRTPATISCSI